MTAFEVVQLVLRILVAGAFLFMGVTHFIPKVAAGMAAMIPPTLKGSRWRSGRSLVRFTGVCEIAGAVGILVPATSFAAGMSLVLFLVAVFPANNYASQHPERFGRAAIAFWPRYFGQLALVAIIVVSVV